MKTVYCLIIIILALSPMGALAVPAYPGLVKIQQPSGEEVSIYLRGDEKVHWMESPDGYALMYNKDRHIVYATTDEAGDMVPSSIVYQNMELRSSATGKQLANIPKNLRYSASQVNILKEVWNLAGRSADNASLRATTGTVHAMCALVEFSDKSLTKTNNDFDQLFNTKGYNLDGARGSVRDFYLENSYGKLDLIITVVGPYRPNRLVSYYGKNDEYDNDNIEHIVELAKAAAEYAFNQPGINVNEYDNDGDGYIDAFHFIYAGYGEETYGVSPDAIWAHEYGFRPAIPIKGKWLDTYSCSPELRGNSGTGITRIGVICHEMGHIFGAPDFYDKDYGKSGGHFLGTGNWDLMAGGSWNANGASPAHINMYQKIKLGWVNPVTLNAPQTVTNMPNSAKNEVAYTYNTSVPGEYYVLENRQQMGFDTSVPGHGLLIYRVSVTNRDISLNEVNVAHPQKMYPVCASSLYKVPYDSLSYGNINSPGCPFPGTSGKTSFTDYTTPSAITWKGIYSAKPVTEISEQGGLISFKFMQPGAEAVNNFTLTREAGNNIRLKWDKPNDNVLSYNIYCNDRFFIKLMGANGTSYSQPNVNPGNYTYCVTACYEQDESARSCQSVTVEGNSDEYLPINNLSAVINGNTVELKWDSPADWLSFTDDPDIPYSLEDGSDFSAVVHFSEDDLKKYVGSKLYQVRFFVDDANSQHTIQVWHFSESRPRVNHPDVEQVVGNVGKGIVTVSLNTPLTIEAGKKLRIGINSQINRGDSGPMVPGKNFYINNGQWRENNEQANWNWYIAGYLKFDDNLSVGGSNVPDKYIVYRDGVIQDEVTTRYFRDDVVSNGYYIYCVSAVYGNGESESVCVQTPVMTGIAELNPAGDMKAYPNPVRQGDVLTIDLGNDFAGAKLSFYSVSGQLLRESAVSGQVYRQEVDLAPGIYILQIRKNTQIINRKIVVE